MTRILIAEDSPAVRKALAQLRTTTCACDVVEVEDGEAAVARTLELHPDLVIVDLAMPLQDGLSAARQISEILPELPILMYTMHWTQALEIAAERSGVRKVVSKSRSIELLAAVQELLAAHPKQDAGLTVPTQVDLPTPAIPIVEPEILVNDNSGTLPPATAPAKKLGGT